MAVRTGRAKFNLDRVCKNCAIEREIVDNTPITLKSLEEIYNDFINAKPELERAKADILSILNTSLQGKVHSIRARIKDPDHLVGKIIRNINDRPDKYSGISVDNYNKIITDLIGIRIIILDKYDWKDIHNSLLQIFQNIPQRYAKNPLDIVTFFDQFEMSEDPGQWRAQSYHAEQPVVYITSEDDREIYVDDSLRVDNAKKHYRSIHYIIRYGNFYIEIQVRTLFEEGWLEFDHRIKYPYDRNNPKKQEYIEILSSLAVAADRLISFYKEDDFKRGTKKQASLKSKVATADECSSISTFEDKLKTKF